MKLRISFAWSSSCLEGLVLIHVVFVHCVLMTVVHIIDMVTVLHALVSAFFAVNVAVRSVLFTCCAAVFALSTTIVIFVVFALSRALVIFLAISRALVILVVSTISGALVCGSIGRCSGDFIGLACAGSENK
jgi:hypothetical protein